MYIQMSFKEKWWKGKEWKQTHTGKKIHTTEWQQQQEQEQNQLRNDCTNWVFKTKKEAG